VNGLAAVVAGLRAALATPAWTAPARLTELLALPAPRDPAVAPAEPRATALSLRACRGALRLLAWLAPVGGPWRSSCLHRAVGACLVLRRCGEPAVLRLGARSAPDASSAAAFRPARSAPSEAGDPPRVTAHAWVEHVDGRVLAEAPLGYTPLHTASR
jgi:hypothetical protein